MSRKAIIAGVVFLLGASLAGATTLVKMNFGDLARDADAIVVGTVTDVQGAWGSDRNFIHSTVTVRVERSLRGNQDDQIVLSTPGGVVNGVGQKAAGMAEFEIGERVLVFLAAGEDGTPKVLGYTQGKSRVIVDGQGRERLVGGSADGMTVHGASLQIKNGHEQNIPLRPAN